MKIRNYLLETKLISNRLVWLTTIIFLMLVLIVARLIYLQTVQHQEFSTLSQGNRINLSTLSPVRGNIYDRNGKPLAVNRPSYNLEIVPVEIDDYEVLFSELKQVVKLTDAHIEKFHRRRARASKFDSILLKETLDDREMARFAVNQLRFPGVSIQGKLSRYYNAGELTAHVIGYVGRVSNNDLKNIDKSKYRGINHIGKLGIESSYEDILRGELGYEYVETNAHGQTVRVMSRSPAMAGKDIHLSIDIDLQLKAMRALGDYRGSLVAIEPTTGDVLALASMPTYDANLFVNGIDQKSYSALRDDIDNPLLNRAFNGRYAPGSTIKGFVGLVALSQGISPDQRVFCPGWFKFPNTEHKYRCWKKVGHGMMDLRDAITQSCDVYFYQISLALGIDAIHSYFSKYALGRKTGIDLEYEPTGLIPNKEWKKRVKGEPWYRGETVISAIGQGYMLTTPLQLATATATIANRGQYINPRLVKGLGNPLEIQNYIAIPLNEGGRINQPIEQFDEIIESLREATQGERGTARLVFGKSKYKVAGKTGTAQVVSIAQNDKYDAKTLDERLHDHSLFIAFAPIKKPKIAVAVIIENGGSGGKVAAPIAKEIIDYYFENNQDLIKDKLASS